MKTDTLGEADKTGITPGIMKTCVLGSSIDKAKNIGSKKTVLNAEQNFEWRFRT